MLNKKTYPMLNRASRRHPAKVVSLEQMTKGWQAGGNWLLAGLMEHSGYNYRPPLPLTSRAMSRDDSNYGACV